MNGAKKFHSPDGPAFYPGERWTSSNGAMVEIVSTRRWGKEKWDVEVSYKWIDINGNENQWQKDAWNFQVRYVHISDQLL